MSAEGMLKEQQLVAAGFSEADIGKWRSDTSADLTSAGFSGEEVNKYFGIKEPDMAPIKKVFQTNLEKADKEAPAPANGTEKPATDFLDAVKAGYQISVSGLLARGQKPDTVLPENAGMFYGIASKMATLAGDLPAMIAGNVAGDMAGAPAGPVGALVAGSAGAFALPEAIRSTLMQHYEKGDVKSFSDFWERSAAVFLDTLKAGATGAATAGVGGVVAGKLTSSAISVGAKATAKTLAEVATMTTVGKALEGKIPEPQDFLEAAVMVGGMHGAAKIGGKLREVYSKTGLSPEEVAGMIEKNPTIQQDLVSSNIDIPSALNPGEKTKELESATPIKELSPTSPVKNIKENARSEDVQGVLDRITDHPEPTKKPITFDQMYYDYIDNLHPLKRFTEMVSDGKIVAEKDDPYSLARLTRGSSGRADQFIEHSPFKFGTLENVGKSLNSILKPVTDVDELKAYLVAKRALELDQRGIHTGVNVDQARGAVSQLKGKYSGIAEDLQEYQSHLLRYLKDSGILTPKAFQSMLEANKDYVPFHRLIEPEGSSDVGAGMKVKNPIKAIVGSGRLIVDPIESIVKNTYAYMQLAERNRVMMAMVKLAEKAGEKGAQYMEKVKTPTRKIEVNADEINKFLVSHGLEDDPDSNFSFDIFRSQRQPLADNEIQLFNKGERQVYNVQPEVADAVKKMDAPAIGLLTKILKIPAMLLRAGTTISPEFIVRNLFRDQVAAVTLSKSGYIPFYDALQGLGGLLKKDLDYQNWLKSGGANAAMVSLDRDYISQHVFGLDKSTGFMNTAYNVMRSPLELLKITSELIENSTRLGEFKRLTENDKSTASIYKAGLESREVTLDFSRIGAKTRAMNLVTAFWNANVQGVDRVARAFKENPGGMALKLGASVTLPSILLWYANHDDPRWEEIPRWQKDLFWIVMTKDNIYRIPKPFEMGVMFGSLPERTLEAFFKHDKGAYSGFIDSVGQAFIPAYVPTFAAPVVEHFANRSLFTGRPLIPSTMEKILPQDQSMEYTSETAKVLGSLVARLPKLPLLPDPKYSGLASPIVLENYIRGWSGGAGSYALQLADKALTASGVVPDPVKPLNTLADMPVIKAFVIRYPSSTAQSLQDFYERNEQNEKVAGSIRTLAKRGDFENMQKAFTLDQNQDKLVSLQGIQKALATQSQFIHLLYRNPDIKPDEKRQQIDNVYSNMIQTAKLGNKLIDQVDASLEATHKRKSK